MWLSNLYGYNVFKLIGMEKIFLTCGKIKGQIITAGKLTLLNINLHFKGWDNSVDLEWQHKFRKSFVLWQSKFADHISRIGMSSQIRQLTWSFMVWYFWLPISAQRWICITRHYVILVSVCTTFARTSLRLCLWTNGIQGWPDLWSKRAVTR